MKTATWGNIFWPVFIIAVSVVFLVAESYALTTNVTNTLSDYAWRELGIPVNSTKPVLHTAAWLLSQGAFIVVAVWLWRHIWYHEFR